MTTHTTAIDHPTRRLVVALPCPYDAARAHYETVVPEIDLARFFQMASWQATLEVAEINAPHGFMRYYRSDITAAMAGFRRRRTPATGSQELVRNPTSSEKVRGTGPHGGQRTPRPPVPVSR